MTTEIYGPTLGESLARYVQGSESYWKTSQESFLGLMDDQGTPDEFSGTWPKSGLMRGGIAYPRHQRALRINDSAGGSSGWPTPTTMDYFERTGMRPSLGATGRTTGYLSGAIIKWPTPRAANPGSRPNGQGGKLLEEEVQIAEGFRERGRLLWPTPTSSDHKAVSPYGQVSLGNHPDIFGTTDRPKGQKSRAGDGLRTTNPGTKDRAVLNPDWVEWLMGVPEGWCRLDPIDSSAYSTWFEDMSAGRWWLTERDIPRVAVGMKKRVDRLKALGNGIVPAALARFLTYDD